MALTVTNDIDNGNPFRDLLNELGVGGNGSAGGGKGGLAGAIGAGLAAAGAAGLAMGASGSGGTNKKDQGMNTVGALLPKPNITPPGNNGNQEEEKKDPFVVPAPSIQDETQNNLETNINGTDMLSWLEEQQKAQWEREDTIRKETQEREDTAYQRAVADMQAAGINPNLMNVNPAASGGGITSATGIDYSAYATDLNAQIEMLQQEIDNAFKEDENAKDRFTETLGKLIQTFSFVIMMKGKVK